MAGATPTKRTNRPFAVGDHIRVSMHGGKIVDAAIRVLIIDKRGSQYLIDFGNDQTALIREYQIVKD
jgi:hypothetical protein